MALIRSMRTKEADHGRATYQMRTGYLPGGPVHYPTLGSLFSKELEQPGAELPSFVSIAPYRFFSPAAYGPGFLGPRYAPLVVGENQQSLIPIPGRQSNYEDGLKVQDIAPPDGRQRRARGGPHRTAARDAGRFPAKRARPFLPRAIAAPISAP